jgi:hypothetical protein
MARSPQQVYKHLLVVLRKWPADPLPVKDRDGVKSFSVAMKDTIKQKIRQSRDSASFSVTLASISKDIDAIESFVKNSALSRVTRHDALAHFVVPN